MKVHFQLGDRVRDKTQPELGVMTIAEISLASPTDYEYVTDMSAWHNHDDLVLVKRATAASIRRLYNSNGPDGDDE